MALPPKLEAELATLRLQHTIEVAEDPDFVSLVFKDFRLGEGFNVEHSNLLIRIPRSYPDAAPDMFWVDRNVALANGAVPLNADSIETHLSREWRRFSWHRQQPWNPTVDNIYAYVEFITRRLREKR